MKNGFRRFIGAATLVGSMMTVSPGQAEEAKPAQPAQEKAADGKTVQERNVEIVLAMWDGVIRKGDKEAALRYVSPDYIQHNVNMPSGRDALLRLADIVKNTPPDFPVPGHKTVLKTVAQGDYVVVIWNQPQPDPNEPGKTYVGQAFDMFRLENGIIVEHWDDTRKSAKPWMEYVAPKR